MILLNILYLQSDIESITLASGMAKPNSVISSPTTSSQLARVEEIRRTRVTIIPMFELKEPLDLKRHRDSIAVPQTRSTVHQNLPVIDSSTALESFKTSGYVIYLSTFTFINLLYKII